MHYARTQSSCAVWVVGAEALARARVNKEEDENGLRRQRNAELVRQKMQAWRETMRWRGEELARPPWAVACGGTCRPGRGGEVHGVESTAFLGSRRRRLDRVCFGFVMICLPPSMESKLWRRCVDSFAERARGKGSYGGAPRVHRPGAR
jgi:hypothetical protein